MSESPDGVPGATNDRPYPTKPQWVFTYYVSGELKQQAYNVRRQQEAESHFARDEPAAYDVILTYEEVPL